MGFLAKLLGVTTSDNYSGGDPFTERQWTSDAVAGRKTISGTTVSPATALSLSAYFACVRSIAEDIAKLPISVYRRLPRGREALPDHGVTDMLHSRPCDDMTAMTFRETLTQWALSWGNGYAEIERALSGAPLKLWPIHPSRVKVQRTHGRLTYRIYSCGSFVELVPENILHIHGMGDGIEGYSVARLAAESVGLALAAQKFGSAFFGNGANPSGVLQHPKAMDEKGLQRLRQQWSELYQGPDNANKTAILEEGMEYKQISIPPEDAQFIETRQNATEDIARWFRMPPHKIQHLLRSTNNNIEHQSIEYVVDTLTPWLTRWEKESERRLLTFAERDLYIRHSVQGLLRGDATARSNYYNKMFMMGALSPNDIRELEELNPVEGGDRYFVQGAMVPIELAGTISGAAQTPAPADDDANEPPAVPAPEPHEPMHALNAALTGQSESLRAAFLAAHRPLFVEAAGRVVRKEVIAATRASERCRTMPDFAAWLSKFYGEQREYVLSAFRPLQDALSELGHACPNLAAYATAYADTQRETLAAAFRDGRVAACCATWETDLPPAIAAALMPVSGGPPCLQP